MLSSEKIMLIYRQHAPQPPWLDIERFARAIEAEAQAETIKTIAETHGPVPPLAPQSKT